MSPRQQSKTRKLVTTEYRFSGREIISALENGSDLDIRPSDNVSIHFEVPSGGDYSGMNLMISVDNPVVVIITREEVEEA